ncbi:S41 family peptidase [Ekhidna sp. MALMAid0563]|uniref:S41 family peptidase n=1 Tax=Ekhidna sp. MALMAid0563 TaxID=3143937 RepID=UPI0032E00C6D
MRFLLILLASLTYLTTKSQHYSTDDVQIINAVDEQFSQNHVEYKRLFPKIKKRFATQLLNQIDPEARYLTKREAEEIRNNLSEFNLSQSFTRKQLEEIRTLVDSRFKSTLKILESIDGVDFFENDSVYFNIYYDSAQFSEDDKELKDRWARYLKYEVLLRSHDNSLLEANTKAKFNSILNQKFSDELASSICYLNQLLKDEALTNYVLRAYLRAYCKSFDPHSEFLSKQESNLFVESLSSESYGTGIRISKDGNKLFISDIMPFSQASFNEDISVGDEITKILINDQLLAPSCISDEMLNEFFYGDRNTEIEFESKSSEDFQFRRVKLTKGIVNNHLNHTYFFILSNENINIGYVQFPSFYSKYTLDSRSAAEDLALILLELKKKSVDGLILDLRNNGGGSVKEAADLLGYFIDYGPLFTIVDQENPEGKLIKDTKRGKVIDSKIIFLVNSLSASASELVASTMQKYPNSLVIGSPTFGKATGQTLLPVKTKYARDTQGVVSITSIKTYRFDGSSYQGVGVIPDILLPSVLSKSIVSEENYPFVLNHGSSRKFRQLKYRVEPIDSLRKLSSERNSLTNVKRVRDDLNTKLSNNSGISLNYENFENPYQKLQSFQPEPHTYFEIETTEENEAFIEESNRIRNNKQKDVLLKEVFQIFEDWIRLTKTTK